MKHFEPTRLTLARRRRGLTKAGLADKLGVTSRSVTAYELGEMIPSEETRSTLSKVLRFPLRFFEGQEIDIIEPTGASFRAASAMTASQRDAALGAGVLAFEFSRWIDNSFVLPKVELPNLRGFEPEAAAITLREHWGLGERPIPNLIHLLESKGVRVFSLVEECLEVNAFSLWRNTTPFIFLNTMKSAECSRFDAAHELGHLLLHSHGDPKGRGSETEADEFASAFLMPRGSVLASAPRFVTLSSLIKLKKVWKVSLSALAYRMRKLSILSEWHYRTLCIDLSQKGYRTSEPDSIGRETSQLLSKVFSLLRDEGRTKDKIAEELLMYPEELNSLVFGLVLTPLKGGAASDVKSLKSAPKLRLLDSNL